MSDLFPGVYGPYAVEGWLITVTISQDSGTYNQSQGWTMGRMTFRFDHDPQYTDESRMHVRSWSVTNILQLPDAAFPRYRYLVPVGDPSVEYSLAWVNHVIHDHQDLRNGEEVVFHGVFFARNGEQIDPTTLLDTHHVVDGITYRWSGAMGIVLRDYYHEEGESGREVRYNFLGVVQGYTELDPGLLYPDVWVKAASTEPGDTQYVPASTVDVSPWRVSVQPGLNQLLATNETYRLYIKCGKDFEGKLTSAGMIICDHVSGDECHVTGKTYIAADGTSAYCDLYLSKLHLSTEWEKAVEVMNIKVFPNGYTSAGTPYVYGPITVSWRNDVVDPVPYNPPEDDDPTTVVITPSDDEQLPGSLQGTSVFARQDEIYDAIKRVYLTALASGTLDAATLGALIASELVKSGVVKTGVYPYKGMIIV